MRHCKTADSIITFIIAAIFGYRFAGILGYSVLAFLVYILLWIAYLSYKSAVFKNTM